LKRQWSPGDVISLNFDMTAQVLEATPRVVDDYGRGAVQRGPLVYCLEQLDQPEEVVIFDVSLDLRKGRSSQFSDEFESNLLGGVVVLKHVGGVAEKSSSNSKLYSRYTPDAPKTRQVDLKFVPYYTWANRSASQMQVWTPILKT